MTVVSLCPNFTCHLFMDMDSVQGPGPETMILHGYTHLRAFLQHIFEAIHTADLPDRCTACMCRN